MVIPNCVEFLMLVISGALVVPVLELLKKIPWGIGTWVTSAAKWIALVLAALFPQFGEALLPQCPKLDPMLWVVLYAGVSYLVSQFVYWVGKDAGKVT